VNRGALYAYGDEVVDRELFELILLRAQLGRLVTCSLACLCLLRGLPNLRHSGPLLLDVSADHRVPRSIADRGALDSPHTDPAWRDHLQERYEYIAVRLEERGAEMTAEQPASAEKLGDVPAYRDPRASAGSLG
jgi:hypothetical protein